MDARQLDNLLQSKINRTHRIKRILIVTVAVLCLLAIAGVGIYYLTNRESSDMSGESTLAVTDSVESSTDPQQLEPPPTANSVGSDSELSDTIDIDSDNPTATAEVDASASNDAQADEGYTHSLQMVWFGELRNAPPEELTISVLHKDELVKQFTLTSGDGWQYTWIDAYPASELTLQGDFPQGIMSSFSIIGQNFTVTGISFDLPDTTNADASGQKTVEQLDEEELPDTGYVWPFRIFLIGLVLVMIGVFSKKH